MRSVQVLVPSYNRLDLGTWVDVNYEDLKNGQVFRLFEEDGTPVTMGRSTEFIASTDAYYNEEFEDWEIRSQNFNEESERWTRKG